MRQTAASAPGKVILFGEHFVVKGSRSLATAISLRVKTIVREYTGGRIRFHSPLANVNSWIDPSTLEYGDDRLAPLARMLSYLRDEMGFQIVPHEVYVESRLPVGAGLGSSASLAAAYALAYTSFLGDPLSREDLLRASYEAEKVAHGNPSGVDNTIAVYGGGLIYRRGSGFEQVDIRLPTGSRLLVLDTGVSRDTRRVVEHVLRVADRTWPVSRLIYEAADGIIDLALEALESGDAVKLGLLMNLNQGLLNSVGASSGVIERVVFRVRENGALGAKLTGAGWGGSVIALVWDSNVDCVVDSVRGHVRSVHDVEIGVEGARVEEA
ncbi:MAG: mevalonate kinase [Desulfurococcales archaeon]|nr:mevalonate kinase [Desulfurococcales archaeon]